MSRRRMILIAAGALLLVLAGAAVVVGLRLRETPSAGHLVTSTEVTVVTTDKAPPKVVHKPAPKPKKLVDRPCWESFGGNPRRTLARGSIKLGRPAKSVWARGLHDLMEYPPTYCNGRLFVNLERGRTVAIDAANGKILWQRKASGPTASSPALARDRLIVSSHGGTITALR